MELRQETSSKGRVHCSQVAWGKWTNKMIASHNHSPDCTSSKWSPHWLAGGSSQRGRLRTAVPMTQMTSKNNQSQERLPKSSPRSCHTTEYHPAGPFPVVSLIFLNKSMLTLFTCLLFLLFLGTTQNTEKPVMGDSFGDHRWSSIQAPWLRWLRAETGPLVTFKESTSVPLSKTGKAGGKTWSRIKQSCLDLSVFGTSRQWNGHISKHKRLRLWMKWEGELQGCSRDLGSGDQAKLLTWRQEEQRTETECSRKCWQGSKWEDKLSEEQKSIWRWEENEGMWQKKMRVVPERDGDSWCQMRQRSRGKDWKKATELSD